jgi:hypothetical protein
MSDQVEQTQSVDQPQAQPTQLQLSDLLLCAQAIQLASQRGAFRAEEFTQVGGLFDRITAFLKESGALQPAASAKPTSDETVSTTATE